MSTFNKRFLGVIKLTLTYRTKGLLLAIFMAVVMVTAGVLIYNIFSNSNSVSKQFSHSFEITSRLKDVLNTLVDAETGERGYSITHDKAFLKPYLSAEEKKQTTINPDSLITLIPEHRREIQLLNTLIKSKLTYTESILDSLQNAGPEPKVDSPGSTHGIVLMDSIRAIISNVQLSESNRVRAIYNKALNDNNEIFSFLCADVTVCVLLLLIFYQMVLGNARLNEKTQAGLLEAKSIAETADKEKTNFLALMSHEIRTPMHDIIATSALLAETGINDEQQAHANAIYRGSMALLAVVNDIIDFSRVETGTIPLENTPFLLHDCLDEVFAAAGLLQNQNRTAYYIDDNIPQLIECDPARLRQVLMSILGEKPKEIDNGKVGVSVKLLHNEDDVMDIRFTIMNTLTDLFESTNSHLTVDGHIGETKNNLFGISSLRFSIAARLISLMGGNIKLTDEGNTGNIVTFTIKAKRVDAKISEMFFSQRKKAEQLDTKMANKLPLNILVVDDHEMNQALLVQILAKMGYTCRTAHNGSEAAGFAVETKFDIIFMDIVMPVMDGIEATKRIREYYLNSDTPVIIGVTANVLMQENKRGMDAGMKDFLIKPYKPIDIQGLIKKWGPFILRPKFEM